MSNFADYVLDYLFVGVFISTGTIFDNRSFPNLRFNAQQTLVLLSAFSQYSRIFDIFKKKSQNKGSFGQNYLI